VEFHYQIDCMFIESQNKKNCNINEKSCRISLDKVVFIESQNKKNCNINEKSCRISLDKVANSGTKWDLTGFYGMKEKSGFEEVA